MGKHPHFSNSRKAMRVQGKSIKTNFGESVILSYSAQALENSTFNSKTVPRPLYLKKLLFSSLSHTLIR